MHSTKYKEILELETIEIAGVGKQSFIDVGFGDTVWLLHGLGNYHGFWQWFIEANPYAMRFIAPDLPACGHSENISSIYSIGELAKVQLELIDALDLQQVHLIGHSMGAQIATKMAQMAPERIKTLHLYAPGGFELFNFWEKFIIQQSMGWVNGLATANEQIAFALKMGFSESKHPAIANLKSQMFEFISKQKSSDYKNYIQNSVKSMLDESFENSNPKITIPTSVVLGANDPFIPNKMVRPFEDAQSLSHRIQNYFTDCESIIIENGSHFVQIEQVQACIKAFSKRIGIQGNI